MRSMYTTIQKYRKISNTRRTKSENLNDSRLVCAQIHWNQVLIKLRMKM